jgi:HlyD family secretion protein
MKFFTKKKIIFIIVVAAIVIAYFAFRGGQKATVEYTTEKVKRGNLLQTVEATGNVEPATKINLNFQAGGVISEKLVEVGNDVEKNEILFKLDERSLKFSVDQSAANLAQAEANLNKILAGASPEDINVTEKSVAQSYTEYQNAQANYALISKQQSPSLTTYAESLNKAQQDLTAARQSLTDLTNSQNQNLINLNNSALIIMDKAAADCEFALDETQKILDDDDAEYLLGVKDTQTLNDEMVSREQAKASIILAREKISAAKTAATDINVNAAITEIINSTNLTFTNLTDMFDVLLASISSAKFSDSDISAYKTAISNKQTIISNDQTAVQSANQNILNGRLTRDSQINNYTANVAAAQKGVDLAAANLELAQATQGTQLNSAQSQVNSAKAAYDVAEAQLKYKKAAPRSVDLAAYRAAVAQLSAAYELSQKNLGDTELKAPMAGVITAVNYDVGEQTSSSVPAVTMMSFNGLNIKVDISESDIAKISLDDKVKITLDALGEEFEFDGTVTKIDPAQTVIQEVIYYKVQIDFNKTEQTIKPGMTANLTVYTDKRDDVLYIPRRAVIEKDGRKIVRLLENNTPREIDVVTGLKADDGLIEILSGLEENQEVITFEKAL